MDKLAELGVIKLELCDHCLDNWAKIFFNTVVLINMDKPCSRWEQVFKKRAIDISQLVCNFVLKAGFKYLKRANFEK